MICPHCGARVDPDDLEEDDESTLDDRLVAELEDLRGRGFVGRARQVLDGGFAMLSGASRDTIDFVLGLLDGGAAAMLPCLSDDVAEAMRALREAEWLVDYELLQLELATR